MKTNGGLLVVLSELNNSAQFAGVQEGDIIVYFDDKRISSIEELQKILAEQEIGIRSQITVICYSEKIVIDIIPKEYKQGLN